MPVRCLQFDISLCAALDITDTSSECQWHASDLSNACIVLMLLVFLFDVFAPAKVCSLLIFDLVLL